MIILWKQKKTMSKSTWSKFIIFSFILFLVFTFFLTRNPAHADTSSVDSPQLNALAPVQTVSSDLPGLIEGGKRIGFVPFLKWLFPFMLSVAAILAVLMIVIAGTRWVASAGSEAEIKAARDMIGNAILGLILAFAAYLIIETINPDILKELL